MACVAGFQRPHVGVTTAGKAWLDARVRRRVCDVACGGTEKPGGAGGRVVELAWRPRGVEGGVVPSAAGDTQFVRRASASAQPYAVAATGRTAGASTGPHTARSKGAGSDVWRR